MKKDPYFTELVDRYSELEQVEAIALGGSRTSTEYDKTSDYDLYVYITKEIPTDKRQMILETVCSYMELNCAYWELEDDCTLKNGTDIDIIYRDPDSLQEQIKNVLSGEAHNGYTTCLWHNVKTCRILYDRNGKFTEFQKSVTVPYPAPLKANIIARNRELLEGKLCSYAGQIKKAVKRKDLPSICHRTAAFAESYFDILFALNEMSHPGEKRMMEKLKDASILPAHFQENLTLLYDSMFQDEETFLQTVRNIIDELDSILKGAV